MVRHLTDHLSLSEHWLSTSQVPRGTSQGSTTLDKQALQGIFLGSVLRAGRGWSGDLMTANCEDLQESEAAEIYVKRFKNQEVFVRRAYEFPPCANGTVSDRGGNPRAIRRC